MFHALRIFLLLLYYFHIIWQCYRHAIRFLLTGTTNPPYEATPQADSDILHNLKLPAQPERIAVLIYTHKYLEEPSHGALIKNEVPKEIDYDVKNDGPSMDTQVYPDVQ